jgi:hypothetical protein
MRADLAVPVLLVKRDFWLAAGSGQTRRIDDVRDLFASLHVQSRQNWRTAAKLEFAPPQTSG